MPTNLQLGITKISITLSESVGTTQTPKTQQPPTGLTLEVDSVPFYKKTTNFGTRSIYKVNFQRLRIIQQSCRHLPSQDQAWSLFGQFEKACSLFVSFLKCSLNAMQYLWSRPVTGEIFGHNHRLRSQCLQLQPVTC